MASPSLKTLAPLAFLLAAATLATQTPRAVGGEPAVAEAAAVETITRRGARLRPPLSAAAETRAEPFREATLTRRGVRMRPATVDAGGAAAFVRYEPQATRRGVRMRALPAETVASLP
jgi:hypothetical protein